MRHIVCLTVLLALGVGALAFAHGDAEPHCGADEDPKWDYAGVHYRTDSVGAKAHFTDMGFNVEGAVHVDQGSIYDCNALRDAAYSAWGEL